MEIQVYKSKKILKFVLSSSEVKEFRIGIGKNELGPKEREGDFRTPEGAYRVCVKNPKSKFFLSLGLNYPNHKDAEEGLKKKIITPGQFSEICRKLDSNDGSLWSTPLGGAIYIHGDLESKSWSEGCIRMMNSDIGSIFDQIDLGTPVHIFP